MRTRHKALLALVGCALLWSSGGFLIKSISLEPLAISGGRSFVAMLFFMAIERRPQKPARPVFWAAVLAYAGTLTAFTLATGMTTAANAVMLQFTSPVFVCLFSWLLYRLKPQRVDLLVLLLVSCGMLMFFYESLHWPSQPTAMTGNFFGLASGIFFGLQAVLLHRLSRNQFSPISVLIWGNMLCFLISLPVLGKQLPGLQDIISLLLLGLFQVGLAYLLYSFALPQVSALELILIPVIEPLLNPVWVLLIQGEVPGWLSITGGLIIITAVTGWCLWRNRRLISRDKRGHAECARSDGG